MVVMARDEIRNSPSVRIAMRVDERAEPQRLLRVETTWDPIPRSGSGRSKITMRCWRPAGAATTSVPSPSRRVTSDSPSNSPNSILSPDGPELRKLLLHHGEPGREQRHLAGWRYQGAALLLHQRRVRCVRSDCSPMLVVRPAGCRDPVTGTQTAIVGEASVCAVLRPVAADPWPLCAQFRFSTALRATPKTRLYSMQDRPGDPVRSGNGSK